MSTLIRNVRYLSHRFGFAKADVLFDDGIVADVQAPGQIDASTADQSLSGEKLTLFPGLIDLHVHGAAGYDAMDPDANALPALSTHLASQGVTAFLPTSTAAGSDALAGLFCLRDELPGAKLLGYHMEGPFIHRDKKGALDASFIRLPSLAEMDRYAAVRRLTLAPEIDGALDFIHALHEQGQISISLGHTTADYDLGRRAFAAGASSLTHLFNAMPPFLHRQPGIIGAALDAGAYAELICDGIHVHPSVVRAAYRLFGPERLILVSDSMRAAGLADGHYHLGNLDVTVHEGIARTSEGAIAGSTRSLWQDVLQAQDFGIPLQDAVRMASLTPATLIGEANQRGSLKIGKRADFFLTDDRHRIQSVWIAGQKVTEC